MAKANSGQAMTTRLDVSARTSVSELEGQISEDFDDFQYIGTECAEISKRQSFSKRPKLLSFGLCIFVRIMYTRF